MGEERIVKFFQACLVTLPLFEDDQRVYWKVTQHEITLLARERTEFKFQVSHILTNVFVFFFFLLCHPDISIHQKFKKYCCWLSWKFFYISYKYKSSHKPPCRENISRFLRTYCSWDTIKKQ